jgi:hypothetical protein
MSWGIIFSIVFVAFIILYISYHLTRTHSRRRSIGSGDFPVNVKNNFGHEPITPPSADQSEAGAEDESEDKDGAGLICLFNKLPLINETAIARKITAIEPIEGQVTVSNALGEETHGNDIAWVWVTFEDHKIQLLGLDMPVPETTLRRTIYPSGWSKEQTEPMRNHRAHVICNYVGENPDPVEQIIALYKVAACFTDQRLLGVLDETAWNCVTSSFLDVMLEPEMLNQCRDNIPLEFWTNLVKFSRPNGGVWLCTKGNNRFGVKEFACLGSVEEIQDTRHLFTNLFHYSRDYGIPLNPGETAQLGERFALRFSSPFEFEDYLESPLGTLVVQKIDFADVPPDAVSP